MGEGSVDVAVAFASNYPEILGSCIPIGFAFVVDVGQVHADGVTVNCEQVRHLRLAQPERLAVGTDVDADGAVGRLVQFDRERFVHRPIMP